MRIVVNEPHTEGYGPMRYTTYRCATLVPAPGGESSVASVRHRFSEFLALRAQARGLTGLAARCGRARGVFPPVRSGSGMYHPPGSV